jgi:protein TonB
MTSKPALLQPELPEWRRTARFLLLALALHAAVLFYPLQFDASQLEIPPPSSVMVRLVEAVSLSPIAPEPVQARPAPPKPNVVRQQTTPTPRPVLAMAPEPDSPPATYAVPAVIAAPPATPVANAAPAAPIAVTAARFDVAYLGNPEAKYPALSRRMGEEGKVLLKVRVSAEGLPTAVDLEKSSNFVRLDEAARSAVTRWRFVPAKRGNEAIEASVIVPIVFRLEG